MDEKALENVLNNKEFMVKLSQQTDLNEVKKMLDGMGVHLTDEELIQLRDGVQANAKELQEAELENVAGGSSAGRAAGTALGVAGGGAAGFYAGSAIAPLAAGAGALIGSKFGKTEKEKGKNAAIGMLVSGLVSVAVPTIGGAALGGWGGHSVAKALE